MPSPARPGTAPAALDVRFAAPLALAAIGSTLVAVVEIASRPAVAYDFATEYCAGILTRTGLDPALAAPLLACERGAAPSLVDVGPAMVTQPTLLFFEALSRLPVAAASTIYTALLWIAYVAAAWGIARSLSVSAAPVAAALSYDNFSVNAMIAQLSPLGMATIALCAAALTSGRPRLAGALAAATFVQPNFGWPVAAALFVWEPRARLALVLGVAAIAAGCLAAGDVRHAFVYVTATVPAQGLAETPTEGQLSASWLFWMLGAPEASALRAGMIEGVGVALAAVALAGPLARRLGPAALVFVPACGAVALGPYLHAYNLVFAMPLALTLTVRCSGPARVVGAVAALCLTTPFFSNTTPAVSFTMVLAIAGVAALALPADPSRALGAAALAVALSFAVTRGIERLPAAPLRSAPAVAAYVASGVDLRLATTAHGIAGRRHAAPKDRSLEALGFKSPFWFGLLAPLVAATALLARRRTPADVRSYA